jgi:hypothetical protein
MDVRAIKQALPAILAEVERRGVSHLNALPWPRLDPAAFQLFQLGIDSIHRLGAGGGSVHVVAPISGVWPAGQGLDHIPQWCAAVLDREADVPAKLAAADCDARHAFIVVTPYGDSAVHRSLWMAEHPVLPPGPGALPTAAPALPAGVDCVWVCGPERVIAWSPASGWADVRVEAPVV